MIPERWNEIKHKLHAALELGLAERDAYLNEVAAANPELRHELESLLASHDQAGTDFLNTSVAQEVFELGKGCAPTSSIGRRIGPYQIVEEIGVGGMGEVYRAFRADDQYQKQVAIKLVRAGQDSGFVLSRFRNERQILATLDHPNIARLLDGGTTEQGVPYFVMELIEGPPIDEFCHNHKLSVSERLRLFRLVCSAVQYAHQHLIIHRDIKPGNILVTSAGVPKLLDFGIAKLLDTDAVEGRFEPTLTMFRVLTPGYASPEQVKGEPITTASDVYSLGVVLYELLTGQHPYRRANGTPQEVARAVCEAEPEKPSTAVHKTGSHGDTAQTSPAMLDAFGDSTEKLSKRLSGDLDNILLMALRKEPQRRYASVEQFAEDIRRHLENLPVLARKDTARYRTAKFISRHKAGVGAAVLVAIAIMVGVAATLHEARIAQRRFNDVRELANSLIFDVHDSIQDLPGSTPARRLLVERSLRYLDSLSRDAASDLSLQRELATAYEKVGTVQGNPFGPNLGDTQGALQSYRKGEAIREALSTANPNNVDDKVALARSHRLIAAVLENQNGAFSATFNVMKLAVETEERALQMAPENQSVLRELRSDYGMFSSALDAQGDYLSALGYSRKALPIAEQLSQSDPQDRVLKRDLGRVQVRIGVDLTYLGYRDEARGQLEKELAVFESLSSDGKDQESQRLLAWTHYRLADTHLMNGDLSRALRDYEEYLNLIESLANRDPANAVVQYDLACGRAAVGNALAIGGERVPGMAALNRAREMLEAQIDRDPVYKEPRWELMLVRVWMGEAFTRAGKDAEALDSYQHALETWAPIAAHNEGSGLQAIAAGIHAKLGAVLTRVRQLGQASQEYRHAFDTSGTIISANPNILEARYVMAGAASGLGDLCTMLAANARPTAQQIQRWNEARKWYERSLETWQAIRNPGLRTPAGFPCNNPRTVARQIAKCDAALARLRSSAAGPAQLFR